MRTWTQQEIDTLIANVSKYPTNLTFAFKEASKELDRGFKGVMQKYYSLKKDNDTPMLSLATTKGYVVNTKNSPIKKETSIQLRMEIMKDILSKISPKERKEIVKIILEL